VLSDFFGTLGKSFDWWLFDKARDEAHNNETLIAACRTNPGANFVVNLVLSFVALMNESETRSPEISSHRGLEGLPGFACGGGLALQFTAPTHYLPSFDVPDVKPLVAILERIA
jgi:hypothetical protein